MAPKARRQRAARAPPHAAAVGYRCLPPPVSKPSRLSLRPSGSPKALLPAPNHASALAQAPGCPSPDQAPGRLWPATSGLVLTWLPAANGCSAVAVSTALPVPTWAKAVESAALEAAGSST